MSVLRNIKQRMYDLPTPLLRPLMYINKRIKHHEVDEAIDRFVGSTIPAAQRRVLKKEVFKDIHRYLITPYEYFLFEFSTKSPNEKAEFVGDMERSILLGRIYNSTEAGKVFLSKKRTYELFKSFMKRDVIEISSEADYETYAAFIEKHKKYIVKPEIGEGGRGVRIEESPSVGDEKRVFDCLVSAGQHVLEEVIEQSEEIANLHPESVNTVRFATYYRKDGYQVVDCFFRMGKGDCIVDNGASGGIVAAVDPKTGTLISSGRTETGKTYEVHPDSGQEIEGFQLPEWNDLLNLVSQLVEVIPEQRYVGWDLAHSTSKGWMMVEGNAGGQFLSQIPSNKGIGKAVENAMGRA